jgi:hypothetical protein
MADRPKKENFSKLSIRELRDLLEKHQATRPVDIYSPEMATWMARKDGLVYNIEVKEGEARSAWKPSSGPVRAAKAPRAADVARPEPGPVDVLPGGDVVDTRTPVVEPADKAAEVQLARLLDKMKTYGRTCESAADQAAFLVARQGMYQARFDLLRLVRRKKLSMPIIPAIPANPWTKPRAKSAERQNEETRVQSQVA